MEPSQIRMGQPSRFGKHLAHCHRLTCIQCRTGVWKWSLPSDSSSSTGQTFWTHGCTNFIQHWAAIWQPHRMTPKAKLEPLWFGNCCLHTSPRKLMQSIVNCFGISGNAVTLFSSETIIFFMQLDFPLYFQGFFSMCVCSFQILESYLVNLFLTKS